MTKIKIKVNIREIQLDEEKSTCEICSTENLHMVRAENRRRKENGLGWGISILGMHGFSRYRDRV